MRSLDPALAPLAKLRADRPLVQVIGMRARSGASASSIATARRLEGEAKRPALLACSCDGGKGCAVKLSPARCHERPDGTPGASVGPESAPTP